MDELHRKVALMVGVPLLAEALALVLLVAAGGIGPDWGDAHFGRERCEVGWVVGSGRGC